MLFVWQIVVAALAFFLGKDEENKDKEDSDSDQEVNSSLLISFCQATLLCNPFSFNTGCRGFYTYVNFVVHLKRILFY